MTHGSTQPSSTTTALSWGRWQLNEKDLLLEFRPDGELVWGVDLQDIRSSGELLFWVLITRAEPWATPEIISDLLDALVDLLNPEERLCSFGTNKTIPNPVAVVRRAVADRRLADAEQPYLWVRVPMRGPVDTYPVVADTGELANLVAGIDRPDVADEVAAAVATTVERMREHVDRDTLPGVSGPLNLSRRAA